MPAVRRDGLAGGLLAYDGQLIDDARLVTAVARTAAQHEAQILTRVAASDASRNAVRLTDTLTGESMDLSARAVVLPPLPAVPRLAVLVAIGALAYAGALLAMARPVIDELVALARR